MSVGRCDMWWCRGGAVLSSRPTAKRNGVLCVVCCRFHPEIVGRVRTGEDVVRRRATREATKRRFTTTAAAAAAAMDENWERGEMQREMEAGTFLFLVLLLLQVEEESTSTLNVDGTRQLLASRRWSHSCTKKNGERRIY